MRINAICILIIFISFSCAKNEDIPNDVALKQTELLKLPFPADVLANSFCMKYYSPDPAKEYLFYLNKNNNSILIYDLAKEAIHKSVNFSVQGDQGVGSITGFTIRSLDSIYLGSSGKPFLFLTDTTGILKGKISFNEEVDGYYPTYSRLFSRTYNDVLFRDASLLISQPLNINGRKPSVKTLKNQPLFISVDDSTGKVSKPSIHFPLDYFNNNQLFPPEYAVVSDGDKIIYSFYCDEYIYIIRDGNDELEKKLAKSDYINDFESASDYNNPAYYFAKAPLYRNLLYDPYRNLFYRFAKHAIDDFEDMKPEDAYQYPPYFSIVILDENLNKVGEQVFNKRNYYDMYQSFVGRKGLHLSISNPLRTGYREDELSFEVWLPDIVER